MKYIFGVDIGGTTVKLGLFQNDGTLLEKWEIPTRTDDCGKAILPDTADAITACIARRGLTASEVIGVGVGIPGPVSKKGIVNRCVNLNLGVFNIHDELSALTSLPVVAGNDANVAALGEYWKGGGQGCSNLVLATFGTGIGGGIIVEGKILTGARGAGGEIGHISVNPQETELCNCGKPGCAEQYASATGIVRLARQEMENNSEPSSLRNIEPLTTKDIFDQASLGDSLSQKVLEKVYDYMGIFLADTCCVCDPEVIVLGGGVSKAGTPLLEGAKRGFHKHMFHASKETKFALATLGNDAGMYGACRLALDTFGSR